MEMTFNPASITKRDARYKAEQATFQLKRSFEAAVRRYADRQLAMRYVIEEAEGLKLFPEQTENGIYLNYRDEWGVKIVEDEFGKLLFAAESA